MGMTTTTTMRLQLITLAAAVAMLLLLASAPAPVSGQPGVVGAMSCTTSLVTSFTPCLNFITNGSASPTQDCCRSLGALMKASTGCACLILTGSVSVGVPINRTLAVTLPRACNSSSLQLQCRDASAQSPAPGPVADAPAPSLPMAPLPPVTAAAAPAPAEPAAPATPATPTATPPVSQEQTKPMVVPGATSGAASSDVPATAGFVLLLAIGAAMMA